MKITKELLVHSLEEVREYLNNRYLWIGLSILMLIFSVIYVLFNSWIMPSVTLHSETVAVPSVISFAYEEAVEQLNAVGLNSEQVILRKSNLPKNIIIDQNPPPDSQVKPGRRVYLTINVGDTTTVQIPNVESFPIREATSRITVHGLVIRAVLPDSIPSPHANTITRQSPRAGSNVPSGTQVTLWYGTGLGTKDVVVPDITGMKVTEARKALLELKLRSVVVGRGEGPVGESIVIEQGTPAGTSVKEGFEIRLRLARQQDLLDDINK